jgi:ubiquinone/menaquinone biosynthesis C-methylase UbiE
MDNRSSPSVSSPPPPASPPKGLRGVLQSKKVSRQPFADYRTFIQRKYDGVAGGFTRFTGLVTGHESLAGRLIRPRAFDVRGCKNILDAGCGDGRYTRLLLKHADADARITAFDLSRRMLLRARRRLRSDRVTHVSADITRLPYPDASFDAVVCGWVLEHLPDPRPGLRELARVLQSGGRLLLLVTEDTLYGSMCSRMWHCRTYNRHELQRTCAELGLRWKRALWFTKFHALLGLGGIIVEIRRD